MLSLAIQPSGCFKPSMFMNPPSKLAVKIPLNSSIFWSPNAHAFHSPKLSNLKFSLNAKRKDAISKLSASSSAAAVEAVAEEETPAKDSASSSQPESQKLGVVVKPMQKPRLVLKFIWMEKNIGLALDQVVPGHGTIPLSPYYFWPRKDAWEELKVLLESKPWISQKQMIILLNQATDIINLWQQSGGDLS
ncbi:30S ribosomal protein 3, chloroplastic-like [Diospyros lotus]|uniref:30S ribosomal protein 3, chloroplastic-like n=1 Tax=Diospyros lotus TaxID=55363 RepID=UPI002251DCC6|nr:30S ribosomal protein 3, chloroplastic-like [Diospyros lotus]